MSSSPHLVWSEAKIDELKGLFGERISASQIAARMGVTRNAVIGKLHRMGLSLERVRIPEEERREREKARAKLKSQREKTKYYSRTERMMPEAPSIIAPMPQFEGRLNIPTRDLRDYSNNGANQCRYIADEPPGPDYLACGNETPAGESYCPHCRPLTVSNNHKSQEERAAHIAMGVRKHLRLIRKAA